MLGAINGVESNLFGFAIVQNRNGVPVRDSDDTACEVSGKDVTIKTFGYDKYRRAIADVILADGRILNQELVKAGLAWWYAKSSKDMMLKDLQEEARQAKRGLWVYPNPVAPWEWRHRLGP